MFVCLLLQHLEWCTIKMKRSFNGGSSEAPKNSKYPGGVQELTKLGYSNMPSKATSSSSEATTWSSSAARLSTGERIAHERIAQGIVQEAAKTQTKTAKDVQAATGSGSSYGSSSHTGKGPVFVSHGTAPPVESVPVQGTCR